jgi:hypothetical protein
LLTLGKRRIKGQEVIDVKKIITMGIVSVATALSLTGCFNNANSSMPQAGHNMGDMGKPADTVQQPATNNVPWIASKNTTRINTSDAAEAAVLISKTLWMATSDDNRPGGIVLADPKDWQSTLVSADLIHHPNNGIRGVLN